MNVTEQLLLLASVCDLNTAIYLRAWQVGAVESFVSVTATHNLLARTSQPSKHTVLFLLTNFHQHDLNSMLHNSWVCWRRCIFGYSIVKKIERVLHKLCMLLSCTIECSPCQFPTPTDWEHVSTAHLSTKAVHDYCLRQPVAQNKHPSVRWSSSSQYAKACCIGSPAVCRDTLLCFCARHTGAA